MPRFPVRPPPLDLSASSAWLPDDDECQSPIERWLGLPFKGDASHSENMRASEFEQATVRPGLDVEPMQQFPHGSCQTLPAGMESASQSFGVPVIPATVDAYVIFCPQVDTPQQFPHGPHNGFAAGQHSASPTSHWCGMTFAPMGGGTQLHQDMRSFHDRVWSANAGSGLCSSEAADFIQWRDSEPVTGGFQRAGGVSCSDSGEQSPDSPNDSTGDSMQSAAGYADHGGSKISPSMARRRRRRMRATAYATPSNDEAGSGVFPSASKSMPSPKASAIAFRKPHVCNSEKLSATLAAQVEAGGDLRSATANIRGSVLRSALHPAGCRAVQLAIGVAETKDVGDLVAELHGHVQSVVASPYGNYVIQKIIEVLLTAYAYFVIDELQGVGAKTARHRCGCRIICRLLEHSGADLKTAALIDEILNDVGELSRHEFGHHVIESILEHGLPCQKYRIVCALISDMTHNSVHRYASHVVETALTQCSELDLHAVARAVLDHPYGITPVAENLYGSHVVKTLLRVPGACSQIARERLWTASARLQMSKYGNNVLEETGFVPVLA